MRVAISGSREFADPYFVYGVVKRLLEQGHTVNVGDAKRGVDRYVMEAHETAPWADAYPSSSLRIYEARWDKEGKAAGLNRNKWMISESDMLVAIFAPVVPLTRGTHHAVKCAVEKGIPVHIYFPPLGWGSAEMLEGRTG